MMQGKNIKILLLMYLIIFVCVSLCFLISSIKAESLLNVISMAFYYLVYAIPYIGAGVLLSYYRTDREKSSVLFLLIFTFLGIVVPNLRFQIPFLMDLPVAAILFLDFHRAFVVLGGFYFINCIRNRA